MNTNKYVQTASMSLVNVANKTRLFITQHQSEILTAFSCLGTVGAVIASAKNTRKYDKIKKEETDNDAVQTKLDEAILFAKAYWPTLLLTTTALACNVSSTVIDKKRQATLLLALNALEKKFEDYKNVLHETNPDAYFSQEEEWDKFQKEEQGVCPNPGETLFLDKIGGYFFVSTDAQVNEAMYNLNRILIQNGWATQYDYYMCLGIEDVLNESDKRLSKEKGWCSINEFESGMKETQWLEYTLYDKPVNGVYHRELRIMYPPEHLDTYRIEISNKSYM